MTRVGPPLESARQLCIESIRARASMERAAASTPGKEATYAAKLAEAKSVSDPHLWDDAYIETTWPYCFAEMRRHNCSLIDAVNIIIGNANRVAGQLRRIDELELDAVAAIKKAETYEDIVAARTAATKRAWE